MLNFRNFKITSKFILWFLFISSVPLIIATYISYNVSRKMLKEEVANTLFVAADNKVSQIEAYLLRKKKDGAELFSLQETIEAVENFSQEFKPMFSYYQKLFGYDDILLINPDGYVIFSAEGKIYNQSLYEMALTERSELTDVFIKAKEAQEIEVSNFERYPQTKKIGVFIAIPVLKGPRLIAVAVVQVGSQGLYEFVQDYTGLGATGETILVSKIKDEAVFIAPLRFYPEAAFNKKIKLGSRQEIDIQKSLQETKGSGIFMDYRDRKTLSVWRYLPAFRLGVVVKMDIDEVFASADRLRDTLSRIGFILLAVVIFMAIFIAHSVSMPIKELTRASKMISAGNLSARAKVEAQDEIGELAQSFNQMTDSLLEAKANVEQKKTELEEQKRLLEEVNKELDSFVYTVSHDLRAPLRGIDGLVDFLQQDYQDKLDSQGRDYLQKIRSAANRMKMLIDDLLTLSRLSRIKNPYEDVDMEELLKSITARLEFDIKKYNVELNIAADLPFMRCDRIKIGEAFFNLISNAIKFSSKNNAANPKVEIGYSRKDKMHEFYVRDNGIGIDKKHHTDIFAIFKRLHKESEYEGSGAGLSIVKRIISDHNGLIWIDSELGKGATFYFTIPKDIKEAGKLQEPFTEQVKG